MIFKLFVLFGIFIQTKLVLPREISLGKDQFYMHDGFEVQNNGDIEDSRLLLKKVKTLEKHTVPDDSHHPVDQENIGSENIRKQFLNKNNFQKVNVTMDYEPIQENKTWKLEKKEKAIEENKESLDGQFVNCQVTTEMVAAAQAAVSRALKGLCNSRDMEQKLEDLENSMTSQLSILKTMILDLGDRLHEHGETMLFGQRQLSTAFSKGCGKTSVDNGMALTTNNDLSNKNHKSSGDYFSSKPPSEDRPSPSREEEGSGTRDPEILKFNSSIHTETTAGGPSKKVFTYYWKIQDMMQKLTGWNPRKSFRSQSFYIFPGGYRMYMRVFPRQNENNFYVRVGLTKGEFDDNLKWPFPLKHKIHVLDQTKEGTLFEDIASRIWDPNLLCSDFNWQRPVKGDNHECVEIGFPHDVLKQREYIREDALVLKLTVYLEP